MHIFLGIEINLLWMMVRICIETRNLGHIQLCLSIWEVFKLFSHFLLIADAPQSWRTLFSSASGGKKAGGGWGGGGYAEHAQ